MKHLFCLAFLLCLETRVIAAGEPGFAFDAANKLYEQGKFTEAASAYEKILQSGSVSPAVYFNLGNALFKSGQIGRALASYRQAEHIAPRDPELRANLQFVRNEVQNPTLQPNRWQRSLDTLTLNEWTLAASVALWLWLALLILPQWKPRWKAALRPYSLYGGILMGLLCLCVAAVFHSHHATRTAIVTAHEAIARNGPLDESPSAFTLHDGAELDVLDEKGGWLQVSAGAQRTGWVRRDQAMLLPQS